VDSILAARQGLPPDATVRAFRTIYFPAQEIHFERDDSRGAADLVAINDPRLGSGLDSSEFGPRLKVRSFQT